MLNKPRILIITEGAVTETRILDNLERNFLYEQFSIKCVYEAEIYQFYQALRDADFSLDIVQFLKERSEKNANILAGYNRYSFAYIYLFFDYDAHSSLANDDKIKEMLSFFDNETDNGMLYLSYPMVEALRHYQDFDTFKDLQVKCKRNNCPYSKDCQEFNYCQTEKHYKHIVDIEGDKVFSRLNPDKWRTLINAHLCKANYIVFNDYCFPNQLLSQEEIFDKQYEKYINKKCPMVGVLSAFPLFVLDYYGIDRLKSKLTQ